MWFGQAVFGAAQQKTLFRLFYTTILPQLGRSTSTGCNVNPKVYGRWEPLETIAVSTEKSWSYGLEKTDAATLGAAVSVSTSLEQTVEVGSDVYPVSSSTTVGVELSAELSAQYSQSVTVSTDQTITIALGPEQIGLTLWNFRLLAPDANDFVYKTKDFTVTQGKDYQPGCAPGYCDSNAPKTMCCRCIKTTKNIVYDTQVHCPKESCTGKDKEKAFGNVNHKINAPPTLIAGESGVDVCSKLIPSTAGNMFLHCSKQGVFDASVANCESGGAPQKVYNASCSSGKSVPTCSGGKYDCMGAVHTSTCSQSLDSQDLAVPSKVHYSKVSCCEPGSCQFERDNFSSPIFEDTEPEQTGVDLQTCKRNCCKEHCVAFTWAPITKACRLTFKQPKSVEEPKPEKHFYRRPTAVCAKGDRVEAKDAGVFFSATIVGKTVDSKNPANTQFEVEWDDWDALVSSFVSSKSPGIKAVKVRKGKTDCWNLEKMVADKNLLKCESASSLQGRCGLQGKNLVSYCMNFDYCALKPGETNGYCSRDGTTLPAGICPLCRSRSVPVVVFFYSTQNFADDGATMAKVEQYFKEHVCTQLKVQTCDVSKLDISTKVHDQRILQLVVFGSDSISNFMTQANNSRLPSPISVPQELTTLFPNKWKDSRFVEKWCIRRDSDSTDRCSKGPVLMRANSSGFALPEMNLPEPYFAEFKEDFGKGTKLARLDVCNRLVSGSNKGGSDSCTSTTKTPNTGGETTDSTERIHRADVLIMLFWLIRLAHVLSFE
jgi:hypothetical protein